MILPGIIRAFVQFATYSLLSAICIVFGFNPAEWAASLWMHPPGWLGHPLVQLGALILGGLFAFLALRFLRRVFDLAAYLMGLRASTDQQSTDKAVVMTSRNNRVPITEFRRWAIEAGWNSDIHSAFVGDNDFWHLKVMLEQAALDKEIQFWGRKFRFYIPEDIKESEGLVGIKPNHFEQYKLDVMQLAEAQNYDIFTYIPGRGTVLEESFRDLHVNAEQARAWLAAAGKAPPGASFGIQLVVGPGEVGSMDCVFAVIIKNLENKELTNCLVKIEGADQHPENAPMPFVLRTEGQIRDSRRGRFYLSVGESKRIPILIRNKMRKNEWYICDEHNIKYSLSFGACKFIIAFYGGKASGKALITVLTGDNWEVFPSLKIVPADYSLNDQSETFISLPDAARQFYERLEAKASWIARFAELDSSPDAILDFCGIYITQTKLVPLFGKRPPSTASRKLEADRVLTMDLVEGASVLQSRYNEQRRYVDLKVRQVDFDQMMKEIEQGELREAPKP